MNSREREELEAFVGRVDRLWGTRFLDQVMGQSLTLTFNWNPAEGANTVVTEPDDEAVNSFVAILRPLLLGKGTSLNRVMRLCDRHLTNGVLRDAVKQNRARYRAEQTQGAIGLHFDGKHWTPEYVADILINAYYAHDDLDKRRILAQLGVVERAFTRHVFIAFLIETAGIAMSVGEIVRRGLL